MLKFQRLLIDLKFWLVHTLNFVNPRVWWLEWFEYAEFNFSVHFFLFRPTSLTKNSISHFGVTSQQFAHIDLKPAAFLIWYDFV